MFSTLRSLTQTVRRCRDVPTNSIEDRPHGSSGLLVQYLPPPRGRMVSHDPNAGKKLPRYGAAVFPGRDSVADRVDSGCAETRGRDWRAKHGSLLAAPGCCALYRERAGRRGMESATRRV